MQLTNNLVLPITLLTTIASTSPVTALHARQVELCNTDYCVPAFGNCIKDCDSLKSGDCFDVISSPQCEACNVVLEGCPAEANLLKEGSLVQLNLAPAAAPM